MNTPIYSTYTDMHKRVNTRKPSSFSFEGSLVRQVARFAAAREVDHDIRINNSTRALVTLKGNVFQQNLNLRLGLCHTFTLFDQIGRFLKVLGNQFACKSRPELDFLGYFVMYKLYVKTDVASIWATFGKLWGTFLLQYLVTLALDVSMYGSCHTVFNFHF